MTVPRSELWEINELIFGIAPGIDKHYINIK